MFEKITCLTRSFMTRPCLSRPWLSRPCLARPRFTKLYSSRTCLSRPFLLRSYLTKSCLSRPSEKFLNLYIECVSSKIHLLTLHIKTQKERFRKLLDMILSLAMHFFCIIFLFYSKFLPFYVRSVIKSSAINQLTYKSTSRVDHNV